MAFSENLPSFENWTFRPTLTDSWISEAFARDTEISLTKALQKSLSNDSETLTTTTTTTTTTTDTRLNIITTNNNNNNMMSSTFGFKPDPTPTGSGSDQDASSTKSRCRNPKSNGGKITKRKSRASKRSPTTFITADPSNFRQMVQQVTGIRFGNPQFPVIPVLKPEPQRPGNRIQNNTPLDPSTFLMESNNYNNNNNNNNNNQVGTTKAATQGNVSYGHVAEDGGSGGGSGLDFSTFQGFPTLESWRVM